MSVLRLVARRLVLSAVVVWLILSLMFLLITVAPDSRLGGILGAAAYGGANVTELQTIEQQYLGTYGFNRPIEVRYVDWMTRIPTFQWGESFVSGEPVRGIVAERLLRTLQYVLPATVLATVGGVALGVYGSLRPRSSGDRIGRLAAYLALAVPNFYLAYLLAAGFENLTLLTGSGWVPDDLWIGYVFPTVLLSTTLAGALVSYTRASANEYVDAAFIKLVRAKGASEPRIALHVLKNAAPPLFALLFAELLAALLVAVFVVESVFRIDGFGSLVLTSVYDRDVPVLLAITYVVVLVGVFGNLLHDLISATVDPRTES